MEQIPNTKEFEILKEVISKRIKENTLPPNDEECMDLLYETSRETPDYIVYSQTYFVAQYDEAILLLRRTRHYEDDQILTLTLTTLDGFKIAEHEFNFHSKHAYEQTVLSVPEQGSKIKRFEKINLRHIVDKIW